MRDAKDRHTVSTRPHSFRSTADATGRAFTTL